MVLIFNLGHTYDYLPSNDILNRKERILRVLMEGGGLMFLAMNSRRRLVATVQEEGAISTAEENTGDFYEIISKLARRLGLDRKTLIDSFYCSPMGSYALR